MTQQTPATENQINYIHSLLLDNARRWRDTVASFEAAAKANPQMLTSDDARRQRADYNDAQVVLGAYDLIRVPADLTQAKASNWINSLKKMDDDMLVTALRLPAAARALGLVDYLAEHGARIAKILRVEA